MEAFEGEILLEIHHRALFVFPGFLRDGAPVFPSTLPSFLSNPHEDELLPSLFYENSDIKTSPS